MVCEENETDIDIGIPAVMLPQDAAENLEKHIQNKSIEVFLWPMAVGTILCASYWSAWTAREAAIEREKLLKDASDEYVNTENADSSGYVEISTAAVISFVVIASCFLIMLYKLMALWFVEVLLVLFCIVGVVAQMRDLTGFVETRQQLLTLKPNHCMNWIGFSIAYHLNSNASKAVEILEAHEGTLEDDYPPENERCEHGEMLLYKISLSEECGFLERALEELRKKESKIVDRLAYIEQEVWLLVKLGHLEEGETLYWALLSMNPDNYRYYEGLQKCAGLYSEKGQFYLDEIDRLDSLYKKLGQQYKWSSIVKDKKCKDQTFKIKAKENRNMLARLLNFSKQLTVKIISESNGFTEFKIQLV